MLVASDYPFLDIFWTMIIFFGWLLWVSVVIMLLFDNFRRRDHSGLAKAAWTVFLIFFPLIGGLTYMVTRPTEAPMRTA